MRMTVQALHPANMLWMMDNPAEIRELRPVISQLYGEALQREGLWGRSDRAVIVGAIGGPGMACMWDTEVILPTHDSPELRPTYNNIFRVLDLVKDHLAKGFPTDETTEAMVERTRNFLDEKGRDPRIARILVLSAVMVVYGEQFPRDMLAITQYPDARLLVLPVLLLRELVLAYLETKSSRAA